MAMAAGGWIFIHVVATLLALIAHWRDYYSSTGALQLYKFTALQLYCSTALLLYCSTALELVYRRSLAALQLL